MRELCICCLQQRDFIGRLANSCIFWSSLNMTPLAISSIRCNPIPVLEVPFYVNKWPMGALSSPLFGDFICMAIIYVYFMKLQLPQVFVLPLKCPLFELPLTLFPCFPASSLSILPNIQVQMSPNPYLSISLSTCPMFSHLRYN